MKKIKLKLAAVFLSIIGLFAFSIQSRGYFVPNCPNNDPFSHCKDAETDCCNYIFQGQIKTAHGVFCP